MFGDATNVDLVRHDEIRRKLRAKGIRLIDIALQTQRQPSLVTQTSQGYRRCPEIELVIARHLELPVGKLFPERYPAEANEED